MNLVPLKFWNRPREPNHLRLGRWGEKKAERFLRRTGLKILGRRVRVGKHDELDLLARDGRVLVIIEVKTRTVEGLRTPAESVTAEKRRRISRAAARYARKLTPRPEGLRFDIVEVIGAPGNGSPEIRHHPAAFGLHPSFRL